MSKYRIVKTQKTMKSIEGLLRYYKLENKYFLNKWCVVDGVYAIDNLDAYLKLTDSAKLIEGVDEIVVAYFEC